MTFSPEWLALRAPADAAARDPAILAALGAHLSARSRPLIAELGCGAGALTAALTPWAPPDASWRLVDHDPLLLDRAAAARPGAEKRLLDLNEALEPAVEGADAIVASAFFDLVSAEWIDRFVAACPGDAAIYAALTYDGAEEWSPPHPDDDAVLDALARHMRREKGLGLALGPAAAGVLAERLRADGRRVLAAPSPWRLHAAADGALMDALAHGVAEAAGEMGVDAAAWRTAPRTAAVIGHVDLFAGPRASAEPAA